MFGTKGKIRQLIEAIQQESIKIEQLSVEGLNPKNSEEIRQRALKIDELCSKFKESENEFHTILKTFEDQLDSFV